MTTPPINFSLNPFNYLLRLIADLQQSYIMLPPPALIVPAVTKHTATVIMAHGLGDSGAGWISLAENWRRRSKFDEVKFIFPNAPTIPITVVGTILPFHGSLS
jgi:hypothetical protein